MHFVMMIKFKKKFSDKSVLIVFELSTDLSNSVWLGSGCLVNLNHRNDLDDYLLYRAWHRLASMLAKRTVSVVLYPVVILSFVHVLNPILYFVMFS